MGQFIDNFPRIELPPEGSIVPLLPAPDLFLFPRQILPMNIAEGRDRAMIEDCLDGPGRIAVATLTADGDESNLGEAEPPVLHIAGIGEIMRHEQQPNGHFWIWLLGLGRFRCTEVASDRPYRKARCTPFVERPVPENDEAELGATLRTAIAARSGQDLDLPAGIPSTVLVDLLLQTLNPRPETMAAIFASCDVAERARLALHASGSDLHD